MRTSGDGMDRGFRAAPIAAGGASAFSRGHAPKAFPAALPGSALGLFTRSDHAAETTGTPRRGKDLTTGNNVSTGQHEARFNQDVIWWSPADLAPL